MKRFVRSACVAVALMVAAAASAAPPALSPEWVEQKIVAGDGAMGDQFAWTVAFSGDTALVGASFAAVGANARQGVVYVFERAGGVWTQVQKLVADDGATGDAFGSTIAVSGDTALISAIRATVDGHANQGAVYAFTRTPTGWTQTQKLVADDGAESDDFGYALRMTPTTALIGAPFAQASRGKAYVFSLQAGTWTQTQVLLADDGAGGDLFGESIGLDGDQALVGALYASINGNDAQGAVYAFAASGGQWSQVQKLVADDGVGEDQFGTSIAMSGDTALVSAIGATVDDVPRRGAAYVLTRAGGQWSQSAKLVAPEGGENENFGYSVALDGGTALVGVPFATVDDNAAQGAAYVYTRSAAGWGAPRKLVAGDGAATAFFGWSAALASGRAAVGAIGTTVDGRAFQGAAYLYDYVADRVFASGFEADGG
jgi:hypothetical protein